MLKPPINRSRAGRSGILPPLSETTVTSLLILADSFAIIVAGYITYDNLIVYSISENLYFSAVAFVWLLAIALMNFGGLYRYDVATHPLRNVHIILVAVLTAFLFLLAAAYAIKVSTTFSRVWLASFAVSSTIAVAALRFAISILLTRLLGYRGTKRNIAIVGTGEQLRRFVQAFEINPRFPVTICGIFTDDVDKTILSGEQNTPPPSDVKDFGLLVKQARAGVIDDVAIALPWSEADRIMALVAKLRELPVHVYLASDLVGFRIGFRTPPSHFGNLPLVQVVGKPISGWDAAIKTFEDYILGLTALILLTPVLIAIAIAIKIDSPGPVIFRQKRLGFNNQVFDVFKFRSMHPEYDVGGSTKQAVPGDPRVTRLGQFLRRWSLDELPQLFNVLNGTMSLVGPRPHALDHNEEFAHRMEGYFGRHRVKPGITGLAQVRGFRGATDTEEKLEGRVRSDIFYAENWSPSLDVQILLRTVVICIFGKNAY